MVLETIVMLIGLDAYLYWIHRALHHYQIFKKIHSVHHVQYAPIFHLTEFFCLWLLPILVTYLLGRPGLAIIVALAFAYEVVLTHRTIYSTTNIAHKYLFRSVRLIVANAKYHKRHHDFPNCNYSQFFNVWDRLMKTTYEQTHPKPS